MWERTLQDLIRGLRANKKDEAKFIAKAVDEIRQEIKTDDMELKAGAVMKLTYLDMLGYDMSWASFHVVEVMSSPRAHLKSVGYLGAIQSFTEDTDVLMLTTNLLKKDLSSTPTDVAITLNGLSHIVTPDLARDLAPELIAMLNHSRPHIRKRAILALYKLLTKYPEAIPQARTRLEEKLDDTDPAVVAATVNVICELARKNPTDYLSLAPQLFHLLTTSSNNWMLIKIIKLFGSLCPHEPRLVKKLQPPITELISTTPAISLLYECVHTCIIGGMLEGPGGNALAKTCVSKLAAFIQDPDQNLKYIALLAMTKIVPSHPYLIAEYQDVILQSVSDQDISIRMRALDLVSAMVNESNLQSIVQQLLTHLVPEQSTNTLSATRSLEQSSNQAPSASDTNSPSKSPAYRLILAQRILDMCSQSTYEHVTNFEWYISVLVDLASIANVAIGPQLRDQLVDVTSRVRAARRYAVRVMHTLLTDDSLLRNSRDPKSCSEVLFAAAWICGEYSYELQEPEKVIAYLIQPEVSSLPPDTIAVYIQAATKIFGYWASDLAQRWDDNYLLEVRSTVESVLVRMRELAKSVHVEVQERAANALELFTFIAADLNNFKPSQHSPSHSDPSTSATGFEAEPIPYPKSLYLIQPLFSSYELNPVATSAQSMVPIPEGLDLEAWFVPPPPEPAFNVGEPSGEKKSKKGVSKKGKERQVNGGAKEERKKTKKKAVKDVGLDVGSEVLTPVYDEGEVEDDLAERERRKAERLSQLRDDPYYIIDEKPKPPQDVDSIPVVRSENMPSISPGIADMRLSSLRAASQSEFTNTTFVIEKEGEMPEGATPSLSSRPSGPGLGTSTPGTPGSNRGSPSPYPAAALTSFAQYEVPESELRTSTPEPIKVVRVKKTGGKKKRTKPSALDS
ncbi:hypothetical protein D9611_005565 [Ephemerocybe angulata]|uniref:AP-3 complex subunit delta n=1 Tax=Ephemerocybe angulata TaxID=980116 RepID=A0A8H5BIF1_9AGAR|nr:hypothetical protein D9611_005565 [Tulosesus angulatus]